MKFTLAIANTLALGSMVEWASAHADYRCYQSGDIMATSFLNHHSKRACEGYDGIKGAFQGVFGPNEFRQVCVNVGAQRINMEVQNLNGARSFDLLDTDCTAEFKAIVKQCQLSGLSSWLMQGGYGTNSGWWFRWVLKESKWLCLLDTADLFRIDPNSGRC